MKRSCLNVKNVTIVRVALAAILLANAAFAFAGGTQENAGNVLTVGATPVPHAEILELVKKDLAEKGFTLRIREFTDYVLPNQALMNGDIDANFFQHLPYLQSNAEWNEKLVSAFGVHIEPMGLFSSKFKSIGDLPNGAQIAIPSDPSNGGRALLLLHARGLIRLREGAGLRATVRDIAPNGNPRGFVIRELEAAQLPRSLADVDAAVINGNYALEAGFNPQRDALIIEDADSPYVNIVVIQRGNENDPRIQALRDVLLSPRVREFINERYAGGAIAIFD
ncbi:MAG: MetQ/NlpA family ABC transporter substrate-binding protein [Treponema sp.]|nr:MetQ/NlpA family ABC transporter substrate-binding protein [Treponema sp.]